MLTTVGRYFVVLIKKRGHTNAFRQPQCMCCPFVCDKGVGRRAGHPTQPPVEPNVPY